MLRRKSILFWIPIFILVAILCGFLLVSSLGPRVIIKTSNSRFEAYRLLERGNITNINAKYDSLTIRIEDGLLLKGYLIYSNNNIQKGTIIFVHGIRAGKEIFISQSEKLANHGYNAVVFDLRAHGESEGDYCTYGYYEKHDVSALLDTLDTIKAISRNYGLWGQSLGGAIALQTMEIEERLKFGIIESTFSDLRTIIHDYTDYNLGFDFLPLTNYVIYRAGKLGNFGIDEVAPKESAKHITQPVIIVHGAIDNRVSVDYGKEIFNNLASEKKELIVIDSAKHTNVWSKGGQEYFEKVLDFISLNTSSQ